MLYHCCIVLTNACVVAIINCPKVSVGPVLGLSKLLTANTLIPGDEEIVEICRRIDVFNKLINNSDETILSSENA